ncbi:MAG: transcriptional repressor [Lachnospiraceae bacterium]|nr:transcriptional repressor [Lachnospiraceae bacterium]
MKPLKYSRQREAIKEFLCSTTSHPTADTVYIHLREKYPRISLGTIYRNLALLASLGEIQRLTDRNGVEHFDADTTPHVHFVCSECSCIYDLPIELSADLNERASACFDGEIDGHTIYFHGRCENCLDKEFPERQ